MNADAHLVAIARVLRPAGLEPLRERYEVREGGYDATRERILEIAAGAAAFVSDPSVAVDAELLDVSGESLRVVANFAVGYDNVDLDACRERSVIVTNTPDVLTEATAELALALTLAAARRLSGERELELIGPEGVLVNTSRGTLVDSDAVAASLESGALGAAGLDVYEGEPEVNPRLFEAPRCVLLPHIGSATIPARDGMARGVAD